MVGLTGEYIMSTSTGKYGRSKCGVWKHFSFDEQAGKNRCIVKPKKGKMMKIPD